MPGTSLQMSSSIARRLGCRHPKVSAHLPQSQALTPQCHGRALSPPELLREVLRLLGPGTVCWGAAEHPGSEQIALCLGFCSRQ